MEENVFGDNRVLGFYEKYAIVYSYEEETLFYYESEPIESMIGCCVETDLLYPITELSEAEQEAVYQMFQED